MNKLKILVISLNILILAEAGGLIYFAYKSQNLAKEVKAVAPDLKERIRVLEKEKQEAEDKYRILTDESDRAKKDRENLLAQTKFLLDYKNKTEELTNSLKAMEATRQGVEEENKKLQGMVKGEREKFGNDQVALKQQNSKLQDVVKQLMFLQKEVEKERDYLQQAYDKLKDESTIKEFRNTITNLTKENKNLDNKVKLLERDSEKSADLKNKADARIASLEESLAEYKKNYEDALKKNKVFEREVKNMPDKFQEIARQNQMLIKETAKTHYNLGVFYTKAKEYNRAASEFAKAVEIDPDDAYSHFNLGYIYAEYMVDRKKAVEHFRHFLRLAKGDDKDMDWAKRYVLTWDTYAGTTAFK